MLLYKTKTGDVSIIEHAGDYFRVDQPWDELFNDDDLFESLIKVTQTQTADPTLAKIATESSVAPIENQEIWAAGVTYFKSKTARMEESQDAGGGDFYDRVYDAVRPEIFFKATAARTVGPGQTMHLRSDSKWIVPEPELTLAVTRTGKIIGYTIGNDLSCRDIEGENPLYLPQAKTFDRCAAIGPAIRISQTPLPAETEVRLKVTRGGKLIVEDQTSLSQIKRGLEELVEFLFRDNSHAHGCFLMTGTGIIPADDFCLQSGDSVAIEIEGIGTLVNSMS